MKAKHLALVIGILLVGLTALLWKWRSNQIPETNTREQQTIIRYAYIDPKTEGLWRDPNSSYVSAFFRDRETREHFHASRFVEGKREAEILEQFDSLAEEVAGNEEEYLFRLILRPTETSFRLLDLELFREQDEHEIVFEKVDSLY